MESRHVPALVSTFYFTAEHYEFVMMRTQVQLAEMVIRNGTISTLSPSAIRKMRKADLAAIMAHHLTEYLPVAISNHEARIRPVMPIKPVGMTRSLYPKAKRITTASRKQRRAYTKNKFKNERGMKRLQGVA